MASPITKPTEVRALLDTLGIRPDKRLGQNFLVDDNIRRILLDAATVGAGDCVLEVGPGLGVLTEGLLALGALVVAVEKDARLAGFLASTFAGKPRLRLVHADATAIDLAALLAGRGGEATAGWEGGRITRMVSNLPYSVGSRILMELFEAPVRPEVVVITIQREVAERLVAEPGSHDYGLLSVWAQRRYQLRLLRTLHPRCFWPAPGVTSSVVALAARSDAAMEEAVALAFREVTKRVFAQRRKQLGTSLLQWPGITGRAMLEDLLATAGIDGQARPEALDRDAWLRLAQGLAGRAGGIDGARAW